MANENRNDSIRYFATYVLIPIENRDIHYTVELPVSLKTLQ